MSTAAIRESQRQPVARHRLTGADDAIPLWAWSVWTLLVMATAAVFPFDASYDVAHYHIHNGWAAWNGRIDRDFAPADMHSFINPAYNMFAWWLIERLPGPAVNAVLAMPSALILPAIYYLARTFSVVLTGAASRPVCLFIAFVGALAEGHFGVFASIRNDAWGAAAFIGALALVITPSGRLAPWPRLVIASLLLGAVLGMKFTNLPYAIAFGLFVTLLATDWQQRLRAVMICAAAGLATTLAFAAPYAWVLFERFGNPVFPMANGYFDAPLGPTNYDAYARRKPNLLTLPLYPFAFTWNSEIIGSEDTKDVRFLLAYLSAITLASLAVVHAPSGPSKHSVRPVIALSVAILSAMVLWMSSFSVLRYLLAAWMLGPLMLAILLWTITRTPAFSPRIMRLGGAGGLALLLMTDLVGVRRAQWESPTAPYVQADLGDSARFDDAFILFAGDYPSAFLAPLFPSTATFGAIVPQDYFRPALENYRPRLRSALAGNPDRPIYAVMFVDDTAPPLDRASVLAKIEAQEALVGDHATCEPLPNNFDLDQGDWIICPLTWAP
ncbi:MAG: hypothetical protein AAGJ32_08890 [Pseudomonadota bacterium]